MRYYFLESELNMKYKILSVVMFIILVGSTAIAIATKGKIDINSKK